MGNSTNRIPLYNNIAAGTTFKEEHIYVSDTFGRYSKLPNGDS